MTDLTDIAQESASERDSFNGRIAIVVAMLSAFLAVSNIQGGDVTDAARDAQINVVDTWNQYQAKRLRQFMLQGFIRNAEANRDHLPNAALDSAIADWSDEVERYKVELKELYDKARGFEAEFEAARARDDLFDLADTFSTVALAMFALAALTRIRWLFWVAGASALTGIGYGVAAYTGWTGVSALFG